MAWLDANVVALLASAGSVATSSCLLMGRRALGPERVLESRVRQALYARICAAPGQSLVDLRAAMGIGWGNFYHHLRRLKQAVLVETSAAGRHCLVFPKGSCATTRHQRAMMLHGATARWVASFILAHPGCDLSDLVATAPVEQRTLYYHVQRLHKADLIHAGSASRYSDLRPATDLAECIALAAHPE